MAASSVAAMAVLAVRGAVMLCSLLGFSQGGSFYEEAEVSWGGGRGRIVDGGRGLELSLDRASGSGFRSKNEFLFGKIDLQIKLVAGNSAGTVTTFYLSSQGPAHDEIDFEFLGNLTGEPYTLHTNVFAGGRGSREQQFRLWFDPTAAFHTYSIVWNPNHIIFEVDGTPIREFKNLEVRGVAFPKSRPMRLYGSLWDADDWATQGGRVKADWSQAPFVASFRGLRADACVWPAGAGEGRRRRWWRQQVSGAGYRRMRWVQREFMIYDYCADGKRFPQGAPAECELR